MTRLREHASTAVGFVGEAWCFAALITFADWILYLHGWIGPGPFLFGLQSTTAVLPVGIVTVPVYVLFGLAVDAVYERWAAR